MVEAAIIIPVFLALVLGMFDVGIGVFHQYVLSQAARQGVRRAIVHGSLARASWNGGSWGTTTYGPTAATASDPRAQAVAQSLPGLDPAQVNLQIDWIDGSNKAEKRVRVTVSTSWTPLTSYIVGGTPITLSATSTMPIAH